MLSALVLLAAASSPVSTGGGPETTLVVVNARSPLSQLVANAYMELREIPDSHLLRLPDVPSAGPLSIADFRRNILEPIRAYLRRHELEEEIDLIAYSADFPYAVDFSSDVKKNDLPRNRYRGSHASLTGLTYFARRVAAGDVGYLGANHYFRDFAGPHKRRVAATGAGGNFSRRDVERLREQAAQALKRKDYATAEGHYRTLLDSHPGVAEHWYELARTQAAAGESTLALESLKTAVDHGWTQSLRTQRDTEFEALRSEPAFRELVDRMAQAYGPFQVTHGFRSHYVWSNVDLRPWEPDDDLDRYYLSVVLAYTGVRGNSVPEIVGYLRRAAASDGSFPEGTVYLLENTNVRSETRQPLFPATVAQLILRGRKVEILGAGRDGQDGIVPRNRDDVIGAVVGSGHYSWDRSDSRFLPGAIAESLTSYGGHFDRGKQTKLTEFLRHGAAGSSGAVAEPYSFQEKFPVPLLHVYYADGASLAEAFYQSVLAPYQLIVVGDPLARPFARFAEVGLEAPDPESPWSGRVLIAPSVRPAAGTTVERVELWVDGQWVASAPPGQPITWDTRSVDDGAHEMRLVAIEAGTIQTRSSFRTEVRVANHGRRLEIAQRRLAVGEGDAVEITGRVTGAATRVELRRGNQVLASARPQGGGWRLAAPARTLGVGRVPLFVRAQYADGKAVRSERVIVQVDEPARLAAVTAERPAGDGLAVSIHYAAGTVRETSVKGLTGRLRGLVEKGQKAEKIVFTGLMEVKTPGFHQLVMRADGELKFALHDAMLVDEKLSRRGAEVFLPLGLEAGWHPLRIELRPDRREPFLQLLLAGEDAPVYLSEKRLGHIGEATDPQVASSEPTASVPATRVPAIGAKEGAR